MSFHWDGRAVQQRAQTYDRDGRMYDDDHYGRPDNRATTWPKPDASHGHNRTPPGREQRWDPRARNHDVRRDGQAYDQGMQIRGRGNLSGRGDDDYGSSERSQSANHRRSRSRSYSPNPRPRSPRYGGQPNKEVMLDGLPSGLSEEDISHSLKTRYQVEGLEDVRIIKDRRNGESRGFGFIRFHSLGAARAFLEPNFPHILIDGKGSDRGSSQSARIRIAYSREREDRGRPGEVDGDWTCAVCSMLNFVGREVCFKCNSPPIDMVAIQNQARRQEFLNSGDSDAAMQGPASQFLLVRGLEPNVTEELLAKGVSKLLKPAPDATQTTKKNKVQSTTDDANLGAREGSLRRVFLVRDRYNEETWRYGFAEFATVDDAQAAVTRFGSLDKFTISSKPVDISYIHTGVFVPVFDNTAERFVFTPVGNTTTRLRYWNEHAYVRELTVTKPEDDDIAAEARRAKQAADLAAAAAHKAGLVPLSEDQEAKSKKRKADVRDKDAMKNKKTTASHLQFWSNRHAELHGIKPTEKVGSSDDGEGSSPPKPTRESVDPPQMSYADPKKMCCYLCSRQFKTSAEVNKHEWLSQLHRDNLQNDELRQKAVAKLKKAKLPAVPALAEDEDGSEYRDRAKERRQAFGASKKISLPMKKQSEPALQQNKEPNANPNNPASSKGAALLGKMGWTSGEGLGANGEGAREAIATNVYAAGVGLGAEGSKLGDAVEEASRNSKGDYKEFVQKAKDKAKARYESMS